MILLSGIPGSGKSTWAKNYIKTHPNAHIVSSDELRLELWGKVNDFRDEKTVWETFLNRINDYAKAEENTIVIADATNLQNKYRQMYHDLTPGFDYHTLVLFKIPFDKCERQNKMRSPDRIVPDYAMKKLEAEYEAPTSDIIDLYDQYIEVHRF